MTPPKSNILTYVADKITLLDYSENKDEIITFYTKYRKFLDTINNGKGWVICIRIF
jgi:hypothetical protein